MHPKSIALILCAASTIAMVYVGLYQSRAVEHLWCPIFNKGCEAVADAPFARPGGIPDGYIAAAMYAVIFLLLFAPVEKPMVWWPLMILAVLATIANILGVRDMIELGSYCFYCILTTVLSPALAWAVWRLR